MVGDWLAAEEPPFLLSPDLGLAPSPHLLVKNGWLCPHKRHDRGCMRILVDKVRAGSATVGFLINMKTGAPDLCSADLGGGSGGSPLSPPPRDLAVTVQQHA